MIFGRFKEKEWSQISLLLNDIDEIKGRLHNLEFLMSRIDIRLAEFMYKVSGEPSSSIMQEFYKTKRS